MIAFASSLDQCGPLTRDVTDAALLLGVMEGRDPLDSTSVGLDGGVALPSREDLSGLRFGVPKDLAEAALDPGVRAVFEATTRRIEELGGAVAEIALPHAEHGISAYYVIAPAEASSNLARYDGVRYGLRAGGDGADLIEMYETTRAEGFGAEVKRRIMLGTYALSSGYYDAYYGQAQKVRTRIAGDFDAAFEDVDFVVTPTSPSVAFGLGEKTADPLAMYLNDFFTVPMSLAGIPAISIPAGLAAPEGAGDGAPKLPVGFQIAAPAFGEQKLLEAAHALEGALGFAAAAGDAAPWKGGAGG
jgi:aspartyl-tRNA(Asn)/glutamyl-tRNA(Gln) amidotransferase subunit A